MADRIDRLFQEWHQLGGAVFVRDGGLRVPSRTREEVIAESTAYCRESGRLTWVTLDAFLRHIEALDVKKLVRHARQYGDLSVLGVLADAARARKPHAKFDEVVRACRPHRDLVPFFRRVERSPLALRLTRQNALELFRKWNYLCNELRYLEDRAGVS